jgi:hypothetical protein
VHRIRTGYWAGAIAVVRSRRGRHVAIVIAIAIHGSCSGEADQDRSINAMQSQSLTVSAERSNKKGKATVCTEYGPGTGPGP